MNNNQKYRLNNHEYRNASARIPGYDYRNSGSYFVTICTDGRRQWFGRVDNGIMKLSAIGKLARDCWLFITDHYVYVDAPVFVIMPDHVHGIITIFPNDNNDYTRHDHCCYNGGDVACYVPTGVPTGDKRNIDPEFMSSISPKPGSLSTIVRSFKSSVTCQVHKMGINDFKWQTRFHEHIIRTENEYERICEYIKNNPKYFGKKCGMM